MEPRSLPVLLTRGALLLSMSLVGCSGAPVEPGTPVIGGGGASSGDADPVVARIGETPILLSEVEKAAADELAEVDQRRYQILLNTLMNLTRERSLEVEAEARGTSIEALIVAEVDEKVAPVDEAAIDEVMADPRFQAQLDRRLAAAEGDEARAEVNAEARLFVASRLGQDNRGKRIEAFLDELKAQRPVKISFRPPEGTRKEVPVAESPVKGAEDAIVTIVEFSDFECPFCSRAQGTISEVLAMYPDQVRLAYKHMPLGMHQKAPKAAEASECAREQDRFWDYHDRLYAKQSELEIDQLVQHGVDLGLDGDALRTCIDSGRMADRVAADMALAAKVGVQSTPMFFVNGLSVKGAQPLEAFQAVIDAEIEISG